MFTELHCMYHLQYNIYTESVPPSTTRSFTVAVVIWQTNPCGTNLEVVWLAIIAAWVNFKHNVNLLHHFGPTPFILVPIVNSLCHSLSNMCAPFYVLHILCKQLFMHCSLVSCDMPANAKLLMSVSLATWPSVAIWFLSRNSIVQ